MKLDAKALSCGKCCSVYEKERETKYRDQLRFYIDGKIIFERYCYGEAAGLVAHLESESLDDEGNIIWKNIENISLPGNPPPKSLTAISENLDALEFDGQFKKYKKIEVLSSYSPRGYGKINLFFIRRKANKNL